MRARFRRGILAVFLAAAGLLAWQPGEAQAHPQFAGKWLAMTPPGGFMEYTFGCGEYLGNGIWRGSYAFVVSNCPVASGCYELRMFNGTQGTLIFLSSKYSIGSNVGNVDLGKKTVVFMNVAYHR